MRERYLFNVHLLVSVEAFDIDDALDELKEVYGGGEGFGIECHDIKIENV